MPDADTLKDYNETLKRGFDDVRKGNLESMREFLGCIKQLTDLAIAREKEFADEAARQRELTRKSLADIDLLDRSVSAVRFNETIATAAEFFTSGRTIARANPLESWPPAMPLRMRAVSGVSSAAGGTNVAAAKAMIDKAVAGKQWLILTFHVIGASAPDTMWCTTSDLAEIADYAAASGAEVPTIADAFA